MPRGHCEPSYANEMNYLSQDASLQGSSSLEDDVQVPDSPDEQDLSSSRRPGLACISDEEIVSADEDDNILPKVSASHNTKLSNNDDHHYLWSPQDGQVATWSNVTKETEALIHLNGNTSFSSSYLSSSKTKRCSKVVKDRLKQKISLHSSTRGETSKISDFLENLSATDQVLEEDPIAECLEDFDGEAEKKEGISHGCRKHSITDILATLQDKSQVMKQSFKPHYRLKGRREQLAHKRTLSTLDDRDTDDELPGPVDSDRGSSSDDEPHYQSLGPNFPDQKKQYVGDRFDEALKASFFSNDGYVFVSPKSSGCGLYGRLQQVVKQEKEKEMTISKKLQNGYEKMDEASSLDVKILSRHLEARLVVCKCSIINNAEDFGAVEGNEKERTIIFSPKVCGNVDVEVGSLIRVYAPWKEVQVKDTREVIILCSYFSHM